MVEKGNITCITVFTKGGSSEGERTESVALQAGYGIAGDSRGGSGKRQLSLMSVHGREWMSQSEPGLCFAKFKTNLLIDGIDFLTLETGAKLTIGEAVIEISSRKDCYPSECCLDPSECLLLGESAFAVVKESGEIQTGDPVLL